MSSWLFPVVVLLVAGFIFVLFVFWPIYQIPRDAMKVLTRAHEAQVLIIRSLKERHDVLFPVKFGESDEELLDLFNTLGEGIERILKCSELGALSSMRFHEKRLEKLTEEFFSRYEELSVEALV